MQAPLDGPGHIEEVDPSLNVSQGDELAPDNDLRTLEGKPDMDETSDLGTRYIFLTSKQCLTRAPSI